MIRSKPHRLLAARAALVLELALAGAGWAQVGPQLTVENLWTFRTLSGPEWSPDGRRIAFTVEDPETRTSRLYVAAVDGSLREIRLVPERDPGESATPGASIQLLADPWTPDGRRIFYMSEGEILSVNVENGRSRTHVSLRGRSKGYTPQEYFNGPDPVLSKDGTRLAFIRESELWVLDLRDGAVRQLTASHGEGWHNLQPHWSPDGSKILYTAQSTDEQRRFRTSDFSGLWIGVDFVLIGSGHVRVGVVSATGGETTWLGPADGERYSLRGGSQAFWSPDGRHVAINRINLEHTRREIRIASPESGEVRTLYREEVEHWISPLAIWIRWSPDSRRLLFTSERSGWNHLYVLGIEGGEPRQLTSGSFTVTSNQVYDRYEVTPDWSPDGSTIFFPSNEAGTSERHLYSIPAAGGLRRRITPLPGVHLSSTVSPTGTDAAYLYSDPTALPELYVQAIDSDAPRKLTALAVPDALQGYRWREPQIVTYQNREDGTQVTARLFLPRDLDRSRRYPAVVFVHGAGYAQSVFRGWLRIDQPAFNHFLADHGYVVLDVDFRGSAGYGRQFRLDVFDRMGDVDLADVLSGMDFLRELGYIDMSRVGIWGHSYGGFMVASALLRSPGTFAVGVSSAPVTDWERFFYLAPGYNEEHVGFPWENTEGTRRASPLTYAAHLADPMLILSGVQDHMHLDAAALVNALLEHRKTTFEWVFYPNEPHGIRHPPTRADYFRRIWEYLDRHLGAVPQKASSG